MPGPIIIADTYLVTLNWSRYLGVQPRNVLGFKSVGTNEAHVGTVVAANLTTAMFQNMEAGHVLNDISVLPLDGTTASLQVAVAGVHGGQSVNHIQPAVCAVVSLKTGLRGPRHRGRVYLGPMSTNSLLDGIMTVGIGTTMFAAWSTFWVACNAGAPPVSLAVVSRKHADVNLVASAPFIELPAATQRRRQTELR